MSLITIQPDFPGNSPAVSRLVHRYPEQGLDYPMPCCGRIPVKGDIVTRKQSLVTCRSSANDD